MKEAIQKAQLELWKDGDNKIFLRPIKELVVLIAAKIPKDSSHVTTD